MLTREQNKTFTFGSVCSGIEAASAAWAPLGWKCAFVSEIESFPSAVLAHHYPDVPNLGDMTKVEWKKWRGKIDLLCGGTPCQSFSVAGFGKSLSDSRGNLTLKFTEIIHATKPALVVWENVPGILSKGDNPFGCFLAGIVGADAPLLSGCKGGKWASAGVASGPEYGVAWRVLDAQYFGLPQRRKRVFVVAHHGEWRVAAQILFEPQGMPGNLAPGDKKRSRDKGPGIAKCLSARSSCGRNDPTAETYITHPLTADGCDASEDGTDQGIPLVVHAFTQNQSGDILSTDVCPAMGTNQNATARNTPKIYSMRGLGDGKTNPTLTRSAAGDRTNNQAPMILADAIRRLTPRECERLQGFPDDHTLVPYRGKPAADRPRYRAIGNSWAVPVARWIGERIEALQ